MAGLFLAVAQAVHREVGQRLAELARVDAHLGRSRFHADTYVHRIGHRLSELRNEIGQPGSSG